MSVRVPDERLDELAASIESLLRRPGQPVADHFRAASAVANVAALVADLRAARADNQRLREALRTETRCSTCSGDGRGRCICDKQVCTCYVSRDRSAPCHACKGSGLCPRSAEARAALAEVPHA